MNTEYVVAMITAPSAKIARQIGEYLVEKRIAACVTMDFGVQSIYRWEGEVCCDEEVLLLVKTRASLFEEKLVPAVMEIHPYDVPEIISLPVKEGLQDYLQWIEEITEQENS